MGVMGFTDSNARLFVNIINLLFLDTKDLELLISMTDQLQSELKPFQKGLHVLQFQNQKILIDGLITDINGIVSNSNSVFLCHIIN